MTKNISVDHHNVTQYDVFSLDRWRSHNEFHQSDKVFNNQELRLKDLLEKYPEVRDTAIDIGSGAGWLSAKLSTYFKKVIAIEASEKAVKVSRLLYTDLSNITWVHGYAEDFIKSHEFTLGFPVLFTTCSVFQHLDNSVVSPILNIINTKSPAGSILGFQELWGDEFHQDMHHIRSKEWWSKKLSNWELDFHGPKVLNSASKGFHGVKR